MKIDDLIQGSSLAPDFPLPPDEPFTAKLAQEAGISRFNLGSLLESGAVRRPIQGVYVAAAVPDSVALRVRCLRLVVPPDCVVVDRHAGWLLGAQMILRPGEHLDLRPISMFRPSGNGRLRNQLADSGERNLRPEDIVEIDGLQVTTALRTAWDLGRVRWPDDAISGLDAMFRLGVFSREEFLAGISRFRGMRWVRTLRLIGPLADGRSESPGESVLRLRCLECGVQVVPQVEVFRDGRFIARLDLAKEEHLLGFEYDGAEWHSSPEQLRRDRERREEVRDEDWILHAFDCDDVFGRQRRCEQVIREAADQARRRTRR